MASLGQDIGRGVKFQTRLVTAQQLPLLAGAAGRKDEKLKF
jgi:hypothetical protein